MKKGIALGATLCAIGSFSIASAQNAPTNNLLGKGLAFNTLQQQGSLQVPSPPPSYFTVRAGIYFPIQTQISNITPIMVGGGVDFTFSNAYIKNGETFFSADALFRTKGSTRFNLFPICINERFYLTPRQTNSYGTAGDAYVFLGLGATLFDFGSSTFRFGGRGGVGVQLGPSWVAEAALYLSTADSGINADAIGVFLGYRFGG